MISPEEFEQLRRKELEVVRNLRFEWLDEAPEILHWTKQLADSFKQLADSANANPQIPPAPAGGNE
jgi:hypothetical protein